MFAKIYSMGLYGLNAFSVQVECDIGRALPCFDIVGLPDAAVKESRDRVRAALKNSGFEYPVGRITINLAPANKRKEGPIYDLPLLLAVLKSSGQLDSTLDDCVFVGELSLSGEVRPIRGILPMAITAHELGFKKIFVPAINAQEGAAAEGIEVFPIRNITELFDHLCGKREILPAKSLQKTTFKQEHMPDFSDVRGQQEAKRALEIAASGGHNALLIGPPGSGKSMLAKRMPSILPNMTFPEIIETSKIHSIAGIMPQEQSLIRTRPFRSPHHTISPAGLAGGGTLPRPGELSLAHNGVLFLDELPEFSRSALEVLRQPIEDGTVTISRVSGTVTYPCSVIFLAAMNPCPCGYFGHPTRKCICKPEQVNRYLNRVSGPLLDRLDLHIEVSSVDFDSLSGKEKAESSAEIRKRVNAARDIQSERFKGTNITCNAHMTPDILNDACRLSPDAKKLLRSAFENLGLSARAYDHVLKVSRTIADLAGSKDIEVEHAAESVQYRSLDRKYWERR